MMIAALCAVQIKGDRMRTKYSTFLQMAGLALALLLGLLLADAAPAAAQQTATPPAGAVTTVDTTATALPAAPPATIVEKPKKDNTGRWGLLGLLGLAGLASLLRRPQPVAPIVEAPVTRTTIEPPTTRTVIDRTVDVDVEPGRDIDPPRR